jgi:outer membrane protein assembly factor BamB
VFVSDTIGQEQWRFQTENAVVTAPFFLGQNLVFIGSTDDRVYAVDWKAQKALGQLDVGGDVVVGPLPFGRHLVVGTASGAVCVIDGLNAEQLRLVARIELGKAAVRGLAVEDIMIYVTTGNELRAVRVTKQGGAVAEAWQRPYASPVRLTAPTASDGVVYVGAQDGTLAALDGSTGDLLWKYRTEGRGGIRHPVIVLDNELYVISGNKVTVLKAQ